MYTTIVAQLCMPDPLGFSYIGRHTLFSPFFTYRHRDNVKKCFQFVGEKGLLKKTHLRVNDKTNHEIAKRKTTQWY